MVFNRGGFQSCRRINPRDWWRLTQQPGHAAQVLGSGCKQELIPGPTHPAQPQSIQLQDSLEMRKQHLDFFPFIAGLMVSVGFSYGARHIT